MKITDLKAALIGNNVTLRVVTDKGIDGYAQVEEYKPFVLPLVDYYKPMILGADPTNVESVMRRIRRDGAFKPWGKMVSTIEMALWDIAGKEAGVPVYKLLGGKVRDKVRVYCTLYGNDKHKKGDDTLLFSIMQMQRNYTCRVSHPEPGMPAKRYFQDLRQKFAAEVSETVDHIDNL